MKIQNSAKDKEVAMSKRSFNELSPTKAIDIMADNLMNCHIQKPDQKRVCIEGEVSVASSSADAYAYPRIAKSAGKYSF